jgi:ribonuclease VapC
MVIDSSALVAVLTGEPLAGAIEDAINDDPRRLMATASILESSIVLEHRYGESAVRELDLLLHQLRIEAVPFDSAQLEWALHACRKYGKGRRKAGLNFGDCFSYALAKSTGEALLFTGRDFRATDVIPALR